MESSGRPGDRRRTTATEAAPSTPDRADTGRPRTAPVLPAVRRRAGPDRGDGRRRRAGTPARVGRGRGRDPRPGRRRGDASAVADPGPAAPTGFRTPFRMDGGVLILIDQRQLPDTLVEVENRSAAEVAYSIREMVVRGAPAIGQVAAIGLALSAERIRDGRPYARRATLRGGAERAHPDAPDRGQPALGGRPDDGPLRSDRRPVRRRRGDRRRAAGRGRRDRPRGDHRPRPAGRVRPRGPARAGRRSAADPDPLQHRAARLRPVRDGPRGRPGRPPRRAPAPRLGRRDTAVPAGRPADRLGAGPGRRAAHAHRRTSRPAT